MEAKPNQTGLQMKGAIKEESIDELTREGDRLF